MIAADGVETLWLILATALVLLMQVGFLLLEGGRVRAKNSINVAQKNISDLVVAWTAYLAVGFTLMYGISVPSSSEPSALHFIFQLGFCATAASIISGGVAERMAFRSYMLLVVVVATLIYPLVGRAIWGNLFNAEVTPWLANLGFFDFAGSTVVHSVGGWTALAAILMLGPRLGRYDDSGKVQPIASHNSVISLQGALILLLGWVGFNGGGLSVHDEQLPKVLMNTLTAGCFGSLAGMLVGVYLDRGIFNPHRIMNGLIGGLVCCTASINLLTTFDAVIFGIAGGAVSTAAAEWLLHKCRFDDPVDVVATHGIAGALGTLMVAAVAPASMLVGGSRLALFGVQLLGVVAVFVFTMTVAVCSLLIIARFTPLRVSEQDETIGLNYTEHGESIGTQQLQAALDTQLNAALPSHISVNDDDEHAGLAATINQLITRQEEARAAIAASEQRFLQFAETASDWLWETDADLIFTYVNPTFNDVAAHLSQHAVGRHFLDVLIINVRELDYVERRLKAREQTGVFEAAVALIEDHRIRLQVEIRGLPYYSEDGEFCGYRGTVSDVTPRKAAESRARYMSLHDELTGLGNRRALTEDLEQRCATATTTGKALVYAGIDLDGFKQVNDVYGHAAGDSILKTAAERMKNSMRHVDEVYRTGGDEFVLLLSDLDPESALDEAESVCSRLIASLSNAYFIDTTTASIGASIGLSIYPQSTEDLGELARQADLALYAAKGAGKGCVKRFSADLDNEAQLYLFMETELSSALELNQLYLVYQPLMGTRKHSLDGFEALLRWRHPERGVIPPVEFIPHAERLDLMEQIGNFVLDSACEFAAQWAAPPGGDTAPYIAVNVSPSQLESVSFCDYIQQCLDKHGLSPSRLELEITEEVLINDFDQVMGVLHTIREMGVSVAIDDFGSGQTSLRYLSQFPVNKLKIDRSFVSSLGDNRRSTEITQSMISLGRRLGVKVLAEGVEDIGQLTILESWDCDQVQGYLFSRPVEADAVLRLLANHEHLAPTRNLPRASNG